MNETTGMSVSNILPYGQCFFRQKEKKSFPYKTPWASMRF